MMTRSGDEVHIRTSGFPVDIDTDFGEPWHLPHMGHSPNDDTEAARIAGARMGGGDQAPSAPMPLEADEQPLGGWDRVHIAIYALVCVACVLALVGVLE